MPQQSMPGDVIRLDGVMKTCQAGTAPAPAERYAVRAVRIVDGQLAGARVPA
jgi:hypothetical protein